VTFFPKDRSEARGAKRPTGKFLSSRQATICCPTAPVAPTTATVYFPPISNLLEESYSAFSISYQQSCYSLSISTGFSPVILNGVKDPFNFKKFLGMIRMIFANRFLLKAES
jgi:hypothetical protein